MIKLKIDQMTFLADANLSKGFYVCADSKSVRSNLKLINFKTNKENCRVMKLNDKWSVICIDDDTLFFVNIASDLGEINTRLMEIFPIKVFEQIEKLFAAAYQLARPMTIADMPEGFNSYEFLAAMPEGNSLSVPPLSLS